MKLLEIPIPDSIKPGNYGELYSTSVEVAIYPDFSIANYIIGKSTDNTNNKQIITIAIDDAKLVNKVIFYRIKFHFPDTTTDWTLPQEFVLEDMNLPSASSLIERPMVHDELVYTNLPVSGVTGVLKFTSSEFKDFSKSSVHYETRWLLKDDSDGVIKEKVARSIEEGFYEFEIDVASLSDKELYRLEVVYVGDNTVVSPVANYTVETYVKDGYIQANFFEAPKAGKLLYADLDPQTTEFKSANLHLLDQNNDLVVENLNQETVTPKIMIPNSATVGGTYKLMASLNLLDDTTTDQELVKLSVITANTLIEINPEATYLDKYSYMGEIIDYGLIEARSVQLDDGLILYPNAKDKTIDLYEIVNEKLVRVKTVYILPEYENIGNISFAVYKMFNGKILMNYAANNKDVDGHHSVYSIFDYNPLTKELLMNDRFVHGTYTNSATVGSTANTGSMCIVPGDDMYLIPPRLIDTGAEVPLRLFKFSNGGFSVSDLGALPFTALRNVSMAPTSDPTKFIVFNGSINKFIVDGKIVWRRENDKVYEYDSTLGTFRDLEIDMSVIPDEMHTVQAFLRKDGKIICFNCSKTGTETDKQNTFLIDLENKSVTMMNNDLPDNLIYRSTIALNNGEFVRISSSTEFTHRAYRYVGDSLETVVEPIVGDASIDLVVPANTVMATDNLSRYRTITIEGTSMEDTGTLLSTDPLWPGEFYYDTLLVVSDVELGPDVQGKYSRIIVLNEPQLTITD